MAGLSFSVAGMANSKKRAAFVSRPGLQQYPLAPTSQIVASDLKTISEKLIAMVK